MVRVLLGKEGEMACLCIKATCRGLASAALRVQSEYYALDGLSAHGQAVCQPRPPDRPRGKSESQCQNLRGLLASSSRDGL